MKNRIFALWTSFSAFLPLYIFAGFILLPDREIFVYLGVILAMMILGLLFGRLFRENIFYSGIIGAVFTIGAIAVIAACGERETMLQHLANLASGALTLVPYLQGQRAATKPWYEAVQPGMYVAFLFLYAVLEFFIRTLWPWGDLTWLFLGAVLYTAVYGLFAMNRSNIGLQLNRNQRYKNKHVREEDKKDANRTASLPVSGTLRKHNLLMVAVTLLCAFALVPLISSGLSSAGKAIVTALNTREEEEYHAPTHTIVEPEALEISEKIKPDNPHLRDVLNIISLSAFGVLGAILIFVIVKKARDWVEKLLNSDRRSHKKRQKEEKKEQDEIYDEIVEDIEFDLFGGKKLKNIVKERIGWYAMRTEEEKVRYLYRHSVRKAVSKGYRHRRGKTAFETLGEIAYADGVEEHERAYRALADAYNTTRYDMQPPAEGTAAEIREKLK